MFWGARRMLQQNGSSSGWRCRTMPRTRSSSAILFKDPVSRKACTGDELRWRVLILGFPETRYIHFMTRQHVLDLYFMDARSKLIDIAAFLDRADRAEGKEDFRLIAFRAAL